MNYSYPELGYINIKNSSGFVGTVAGMKENNKDGSRVSSQG